MIPKNWLVRCETRSIRLSESVEFEILDSPSWDLWPFQGGERIQMGDSSHIRQENHQKYMVMGLFL